LSVETVNVTVCVLSDEGPAEMAVAQLVTAWAPESSSTVWFPPAVKLGATFTWIGGDAGVEVVVVVVVVVGEVGGAAVVVVAVVGTFGAAGVVVAVVVVVAIVVVVGGAAGWFSVVVVVVVGGVPDGAAVCTWGFVVGAGGGDAACVGPGWSATAA
jgi:hypothetical protein